MSESVASLYSAYAYAAHELEPPSAAGRYAPGSTPENVAAGHIWRTLHGADLGIRPIVMGLTVLSTGASMPELTIGVVAAMEATTSLAVGNIAGTNRQPNPVALAVATITDLNPVLSLTLIRSPGTAA